MLVGNDGVGDMTHLVILLHDILLAAWTSMEFMHAFVFLSEILPSGLFVAVLVGTVHESIPTILVDVRLDMPPGNGLRTTTL